MTENGLALDDIKATRLRDVAYSAGVDTTDATKKAELIDRLRDEGVEFGQSGFERNGEPFEVEQRPKGRGPSDKTLLYAFKREATPEELIEAMEEMAEERGLELREGSTESGKDTLTIVRPAEVHESGEEACQATTGDGEPCQNPTESGSDFCHLDSHGPEEGE